MLDARQSPLVPGALPSAAPRAQTWVRVLRPFVFGGMVIERGTERAIDTVFAAELVAANKAERIDPPQPKSPPAAKATATAKKD